MPRVVLHRDGQVHEGEVKDNANLVVQAGIRQFPYPALRYGCGMGKCARCACRVLSGGEHLPEPNWKEKKQLGPRLEEGYRLALPASHPLAAREEVAAEELAADTMIVRRHCEALAATSRHFTARGVRPFFALRTYDDGRAMALVEAGLGLTVMPDCFAAPGISRPRLSGFDERRTIGLLHAPGLPAERRARSPILDALRRAASPAA